MNRRPDRRSFAFDAPAPAPAGAGRFFIWAVTAPLAVAGFAFLTAAAPGPYREGPPPGFTGGFGEESCTSCHFGGDLNEAPGSLSIEGLPERHLPGEAYLLTLTLVRPGMALGGFQLSARFAQSGGQAGELAAPKGEEGRIAVTASNGVEYAHHLRPGTGLTARDTARWTVVWRAPAGAGEVRFHAAANAADDNDSPSGDVIYTAAASSRPSGG